jgi:hypothetical protein
MLFCRILGRMTKNSLSAISKRGGLINLELGQSSFRDAANRPRRMALGMLGSIRVVLIRPTLLSLARLSILCSDGIRGPMFAMPICQMSLTTIIPDIPSPNSEKVVGSREDGLYKSSWRPKGCNFIVRTGGG